MIVQLNESLLLSEGNSRVCYRHPLDDTKVIKIEKPTSAKPNNKIDYIYCNYLKKKNIDLRFISRCYEWIDTNLGKGLVFDLVQNYDGSHSKTLNQIIHEKYLGKSEIQHLFKNLMDYLKINQILFIDISLDNILLKIDGDNKQFVIVDGLGSRKLKLQFWINLKSNFFTRRKVAKQARKLQDNFEILLEKRFENE